jgi:hypothetical protein
MGRVPRCPSAMLLGRQSMWLSRVGTIHHGKFGTVQTVGRQIKHGSVASTRKCNMYATLGICGHKDTQVRWPRFSDTRTS